MEKHTTPINSIELGQAVSTYACFNLRKASRIITQHFDDILKPSGLLTTESVDSLRLNTILNSALDRYSDRATDALEYFQQASATREK